MAAMLPSDLGCVRTLRKMLEIAVPTPRRRQDHQGHRDVEEVVPNHQTPVESITQELVDSLHSGGGCDSAVRPGMCQEKAADPAADIQISQIAPCKPEKIMTIPYSTLQGREV
uniref:(northern house mosquito) hypothetical protein n=1 Tax=Culex pipiens TaxID=7175 RepID=A0A8D8BWE6_CULPI